MIKFNLIKKIKKMSSSHSSSSEPSSTQPDLAERLLIRPSDEPIIQPVIQNVTTGEISRNSDPEKTQTVISNNSSLEREVENILNLEKSLQDKIKDKYKLKATQAKDWYESTAEKIQNKASETSEYVKNAKVKLAASAAGASDYTKEVLDKAQTVVTKQIEEVRKAFIGKKEDARPDQLDNEFIEYGYRVDHDSCSAACASLFTCHNETVNVWSHFLGALLFLAFLIGLSAGFVPRRFEIGRELLKEYPTSNPGLINFIDSQIGYLNTMTDELLTLPTDNDVAIKAYKHSLRETFQTNQGITYFALSRFFNFDFVTASDVPSAIT